MPNKSGHTFSFEYQETTGVNRTARLTSTNIEISLGGIGVHANDSQWQVLRQGESNWNGDFDWLTYLGTDGNPWETTVHCSAFGSDISISFESKRADTGDGDNSTMRIVDWDGKQWTVVIDADISNPTGPTNVGFTLS